MKKMMIFLVVIIVIFSAITFITNTQKTQKSKGNPYNKNNLRASTIDQLNDPNYQNLILPDELAKDLKNKEDKTVYFYSPECPHCQRTTPIVAPLAEEMGIDLVQYNLLEFEQGWDDYHIDSTPTIIYFKNGVESKRIVGYNEKEVFKKWFEDNHINQK